METFLQVLILSETQMDAIRLPNIVSGQYSIYRNTKRLAVISAYRNQWHLQAMKGVIIDHKHEKITLENGHIYSLSSEGNIHVLLFLKEKQYPYLYRK